LPEVRPLRRGEEQLWMNLKAYVASGRLDSEDVDVALGKEDGRAFLIALDGARCVGRLRGKFLHPKLYFVREILTADDEGSEEVVSSLCAYLADSFASDGTEILSSDKPTNRQKNISLEAAGFVIGKSKIFVERDVAGYESPYDDPFEYRTLAQLGEDRFIEIMTEAAQGDPFENVADRDPREDFRELVQYAGERFDPTWWRVAYRDGRPIGVVLPQAFADPAGEGSLFYVGVLPSYRGHGFGKALHAAGLEFLAGHGITHYVGSTDTRNGPMVAVFMANGCERTSTQYFYKALRRGDR
jgi:ribosomal protein S18 acetylase RimI-like enzyme